MGTSHCCSFGSLNICANLQNAKFGKGNLYLNKNQFGRNKFCCAEDNHSHMNDTCAKECSDSNFN